MVYLKMISRIIILLIITYPSLSNILPEARALENVLVGELVVCTNNNCSPLSGNYNENSGPRNLTKTVTFNIPFSEPPRVAAYLLTY